MAAKKKVWIDARGQEVPEEYVSQIDKEKDFLVNKLVDEAVRLQNALSKFKEEAVYLIDEYLNNLAKAKRVKEDWKGNITLESFDGSLRIGRAMSDQIVFDEKLQLAKTAVNDWIKEQLAGANEAIVKLITNAFNVDKKGQINKAALLKLLRLDIDDAKWKKAMEILKESLQVSSTKLYLRFFLKKGNGSEETWINIPLDITTDWRGL